MPQRCHTHFSSARARARVFTLLLPFVLFMASPAMAAKAPQVGVYYFDGWADTSPQSYHMQNLPQHFPGREPLSGWYDNSAALVHQQVKWARSIGVNFFIFDWYAPRRYDHTLNSAVAFLQQDTHKLGMKYALLYVNNGELNIPQADWKAACQHWVNDYFKDAAYYKINDKPLLPVFSVPDMEKNWGGPQGVARAWDELRAAAKEAGLPGVFVVACAYPRPKENLNRLAGEGYDAYSGYNYAGMKGTVKGENPYSLIVQGSQEIWNDFAADSRKPYIPVVTDGWDPRPWNETPYWYKRSPEEFRDFVTAALRWWHEHPAMRVMETTPLIFVEAWNEVGEGSYLLPTRDDGFTYMNALREGLKKGR